MNGAHDLLRTLAGSGVDVVFANPGTSEVHLVAALDDVPAVRSVLTLFEGVATGAADGYARVAGRPAATLLHLGPGLANGLANLHNARRARSPVVNVVGDHATYHKRFDAPLESDVDALARTVSGWLRTCSRADDLGADTAAAVAAALGPPGCVATLVVPADVSWSDSAAGPAAPLAAPAAPRVPGAAVDEAARALRRGGPSALLLGGAALTARGLAAAAQAAAATGARLLCETFPARLERGGGLPGVERLGYLPESVHAQLRGLQDLVLVATGRPVSFFAYPGHPGDLVPPGCSVHVLAAPGHDAAGALEELAGALGPGSTGTTEPPPGRPSAPTGALTAAAFAAAVGVLLPEGAVVVDEANTSGVDLPAATSGAPRHDWLTLTGGAIGMGLPVATGAALAAPGRRVLCLESDGSALYTPQALWTQAREGLDVTTVVLSNRSYAIVDFELQRATGGAGPRARRLVDLSGPPLDIAALSVALGVPATRATTADELVRELRQAIAEPGPRVVEAILATG